MNHPVCYQHTNLAYLLVRKVRQKYINSENCLQILEPNISHQGINFSVKNLHYETVETLQLLVWT